MARLSDTNRRTIGVTLPWVLAASLAAPVQAGTLTLTLEDAESSATVPARVEVQGADGSYVVAADALPYASDCRMSKPGAGLLDDAASVQPFTGRLAIENPYTDSTQFYSTGRSTITLPPGRATVRVFKGPEFAVAKAQVDVPASGTVELSMPLKRWTNMPAKGWYSGDDHLHIQRATPDDNTHVSAMMQAEDVHVANLLQMGKVGDFAIAPQYAHGPAGHYQQGHYILAAGQENPRSHFLGHTITLGAKRTHYNEEQYLVYRLIWEQTVKEGAINGYAHAVFPYASFIAPHDGLAVVVPHGLMHFLEVLQFDRTGYDIWYDLLALGLRITPTAGTDYPCGGQVIPGHERFYTKVDGPLTYNAWLDSVRAGRTFVTTGPVVELSVNGEDIGATVALDAPGTVKVTGTVTFDPARDSLSFVELLQDGEVVGRYSPVAGASKIAFAVDQPVERGGWLAVRGYGTKLDELPFPTPVIFGTFAPNTNFHTAPVYVTVAGQPGIEQSERTRRVAKAFIARLDDLARLLGEDNHTTLAARLERPTIDAVPEAVLASSRPRLLEEISIAKAYFAGFLD